MSAYSVPRPGREVEMAFSEIKSPLQFWLLPDHDLGAHRHATIEIGDVGIDQAETAGGDLGADRIRPVGAVNAIDRGAEIHRARAERIARATGHEARQIGLAFDHFRRRHPVRPLSLAGNTQQSLPLESVTADADSVTKRTAARLDQIEMPFSGRNDDGARWLGGAEIHHLFLPLRIEFVAVVGDQAGLVALVGLLRKTVRGRKHQTGCGDCRADQVTHFYHFKPLPSLGRLKTASVYQGRFPIKSQGQDDGKAWFRSKRL